jgi:hypothetical protein
VISCWPTSRSTWLRFSTNARMYRQCWRSDASVSSRYARCHASSPRAASAALPADVTTWRSTSRARDQSSASPLERRQICTKVSSSRANAPPDSPRISPRSASASRSGQSGGSSGGGCGSAWRSRAVRSPASGGTGGGTAGRQPHERRTTSSVGTRLTSGTPVPRRSPTATSTAHRPISRNGARTVVSDTVLTLTATSRRMPSSSSVPRLKPRSLVRKLGQSSYPTIAIPSRPADSTAEMAPAARSSLEATIASGTPRRSMPETQAADSPGLHVCRCSETSSGSTAMPCFWRASR